MSKTEKARRDTDFEIAYSEIAPDLQRVLISLLRDPESAADALQDTGIRLYEKRHSLREKEKFEPWAKKIAMNTGLTYLRKKTTDLIREKPMEDISPEEERSLGVLCREYEGAEQRKDLRKLFGKIPPEDRILLVLQGYSGMGEAAIAKHLNLSEETVRNRSRSAVYKLKQYSDRFE